MHLPDGILSPAVCATTLFASGLTVSFAIKKASKETSSKPFVLATSATIILLAQAINFPVSNTVSGHLLGGAMLTWLFGPWVAICLMTLVLGLQGTILGDGGTWSFGANLLTLAIAPILLATFARNASARYRTSRLQTLVTIGFSTTVGYLCSALCVAGLLAMGAPFATGRMAGALAQNSLLPAIIEGMVTVAIMSILLRKPSMVFGTSLKAPV